MARSTLRGFTLVELAIALAVLGVLMVLGLPQFTSWINNTKIRTAAEGILNGVQLARAEAVRQNLGVQFVLGAQSDWTVNAIGTGGALVAVQSKAGNEGSSTTTLTVTPAGATILTFNSLGRVTSNGDGSASISALDVTSTTVSPETRNMRITVSSGGTVRMCDPHVVAIGDPRGC